MTVLPFSYPSLAHVNGSLYIIFQYVYAAGILWYFLVVSKGQLGNMTVEVERVFTVVQCFQYAYHYMDI